MEALHTSGLRFGSQYEDSGGDMVTLSILDLLIFQIKASGEKVRDLGGISVPSGNLT